LIYKLEISDDDILDGLKRRSTLPINKDRNCRLITECLPVDRLCLVNLIASKFREGQRPLLRRFEIVKQ
jgi:hypothetical protein